MEKFRSYFFFCFSAWNFLIYKFGKKQKHLVQLCNNTNLRGKGLCFQSMYGVCKSVICYVFLPLTDFLHFHCCFFYVASSFCYLKSPVQFWKGGLCTLNSENGLFLYLQLDRCYCFSVTMDCSLFRKYRIRFLYSVVWLRWNCMYYRSCISWTGTEIWLSCLSF